MDKLSGKDFNRPQYQKLLKKCGPATATRYVDLMLQKIQKGEFDATDIITHTLSLEEGSHAYSIFDKKEDNCIKVILNHRTIINRSCKSHTVNYNLRFFFVEFIANTPDS